MVVLLGDMTDTQSTVIWDNLAKTLNRESIYPEGLARPDDAWVLVEFWCHDRVALDPTPYMTCLGLYRLILGRVVLVFIFTTEGTNTLKGKLFSFPWPLFLYKSALT